MNRIIKAEVVLLAGTWFARVTKEFAPEHGGGTQVFAERVDSLAHGLRQVCRMVPLVPDARTNKKEDRHDATSTSHKAC